MARISCSGAAYYTEEIANRAGNCRVEVSLGGACAEVGCLVEVESKALLL